MAAMHIDFFLVAPCNIPLFGRARDGRLLGSRHMTGLTSPSLPQQERALKQSSDSEQAVCSTLFPHDVHYPPRYTATCTHPTRVFG